MNSDHVTKTNAEISALMAERLHLRGTTLTAQLRRGKGLLPARVRRAAVHLVETEGRIAHPRLRGQIDKQGFNAAAQTCRIWLSNVDAEARTKAKREDFWTSMGINALVFGAFTFALLAWRGFL